MSLNIQRSTENLTVSESCLMMLCSSMNNRFVIATMFDACGYSVIHQVVVSFWHAIGMMGFCSM